MAKGLCAGGAAFMLNGLECGCACACEKKACGEPGDGMDIE